MSRRLYFFLFQRKLYILFSISFLIFWNSINLAYVSQLGNEDLVSDYIFTSQRESHSVPDMGFLLTFNYFVPFGVIENRFTKINFKYFNGNCDYSSCPGWWILFFYMLPHKGLAIWKNYLWTSLFFSYSLKITYILLRQGFTQRVCSFRRGGGRVTEKRTKTNRGRGWDSSMFLKNAEIFKIKFYSYSPVFPVDYNESMKY